jgi:hypothetical protein
VSIVVLVGDRRERAEDCLSSILSQARLQEAEILLIECGRGTHPPLRGSEGAGVKRIEGPKPASSGLARAHAVRAAAAPIVAFLEEHVRAEPGWLGAVMEAHRSPAAAIGAVMICGNPGEGVSDAIHLMNYSEYLPSSPLREDLAMLEGHNCTYKRDVLLSYGDRLPLLMSNEPLLHWRLREDGQVLQLNPAIRVIHRNETKLRDICRGYFLWSVNFGDSRASIQAFTWWKRWAYVLGAPAVPFVRAARMARTAYRQRNRDLFLTLLRFLPAILVAQLASALGQSVGLVFGRLSAEPAFLDYEVNVDRGVLGNPEFP